MNAQDVLKYGHTWVHRHVDGLTPDQWLAPHVCGVWSVKDILAHLTSFEWVLAEVLLDTVDPGPTPTLNMFTSMDGDSFNAFEVGQRREKTAPEVLAEYDEGYERVMSIVPRIDPEVLRQPGTLPWYGMEYSIEDWIVYQFYGHKREHMAQVAMYLDRLKEK